MNDVTESSVIQPSHPIAESSPKSPLSPISQLSHPDDLSSVSGYDSDATIILPSTKKRQDPHREMDREEARQVLNTFTLL